jgi:hypothetical protein
MRMTPPKDKNRPAILNKVSLSRKTRNAMTGEKTGIVAITTEAIVEEEYFSP